MAKVLTYNLRPNDYLAGLLSNQVQGIGGYNPNLVMGVEGGDVFSPIASMSDANRFLAQAQMNAMGEGGSGQQYRIQDGYLQRLSQSDVSSDWQNLSRIIGDQQLANLQAAQRDLGTGLYDRDLVTYNNADAIANYLNSRGGPQAFGFDPRAEWANTVGAQAGLTFDQFQQSPGISWQKKTNSPGSFSDIADATLQIATPLAIMGAMAYGGSALAGSGAAGGAGAGAGAAGGASAGASGASAAGGAGAAAGAGAAIPELGLIATPATANAAVAAGIPSGMLAGGTGALTLGGLYGPMPIQELGMVANPATADAAIAAGIPPEMLAGGPGALSLGAPTAAPQTTPQTTVPGNQMLDKVLSSPQALGALGGALLGGMGGSSGPAGETTTTTDSGLPDWLLPYVKPALDSYSSQIQNYNVDPYGVMPSAMKEFNQTLSGYYLDPSSNKYLSDFYKLGAERIKGTVMPSFGHMQAFGSHSGYNEALSRGLADFSTGLFGGAYEKERDRMSNFTTSAPSFLNSTSQARFAPYQSYLNTVGNLGKKSTTTQPYFQPSEWQNILGGASLGWGLGNIFKS